MKNKVFRIIISLLFLILFNILFFVIGGTERTNVDWLSYGFITASYLLLLATPLFYSSRKGLAVLEYTLYSNATVYFFIELIAGIGFIFLQYKSFFVEINPFPWALAVQAILLVIFLIIQLSSAIANSSTEAAREKQRSESIAIQSLAQKIRTRMRDIDDPELRKKVEQCYEDVSSASIETFPEAEDAELALRNSVEMLCEAIEDEDTAQIEKKAKRVANALADRNAIIRQCRLSR